MNLSGQRVYIHGRLRGLTKRRVGQLAKAGGFGLSQRPQTADMIALGHSSLQAIVSAEGELRLPYTPKVNAALISERFFGSQLGIYVLAENDAAYSAEQLARHAQLSPAQLRTLSLYDIINPTGNRFGYADLAVARAVGRLAQAGTGFPRIMATALALMDRGTSLSGVRLTEAPWGELLQQFEGNLARFDGQLLLPFHGDDIDADDAFARAEASEQAGDLEAAARWYDLAAKLDERDGVIPFNLANVLDELGRGREAEIAYRQAIARDPNLADAWFNLGVLQEKANRDDEAQSSYARAFSIEATYADALHNAALLHMRHRRFGAALPLLDRLIALNLPDAAEAKRLAHLCRLELQHGAGRA